MGDIGRARGNQEGEGDGGKQQWHDFHGMDYSLAGRGARMR
jgi:hypothetical protein